MAATGDPMSQITLHNTRTRRREAFAPLDPQNVRMYVCGPTVYDRAHLGNARPVVVFDVLYRLLRHVYGADHVTYVRNFTDVDDKINARAREMQAAGDSRPLNAIIRTLTDETIGWYHEDMGALGTLAPTHEPRATEWIGAMIGMIEGLMARGHAYVAEGHVLFDVRSFPDYGKLSGRSVDDMIAGSRVEVAPYKRDPMDFVLWKPSAEDEPGWDGPVWEGKSVGRGRPGWHIECSAMSRALLGESFDIHGGGIDLQFPHHENEIAQSCCAHPESDFARFWLHNEMVQVEGRKMSKSLGNFFTVHELFAGVHAPERGSDFPPLQGFEIRWCLLQTHYRKPMDFTVQRAEEARKIIRDLAQLTEGCDATQIDPRVVEALRDDLNTPLALTRLLELRAEVAKRDADPGVLLATLRFLGFFEFDALGVVTAWGRPPEEHIELAERIAERWMALRREKDFKRADVLKACASRLGVELRVEKHGGSQHGIADLEGPIDVAAAKELLE